MCLRSVTEKRQSFSERICDDLCEEILKYLPIEDRFRLEGVSKQFQRTIFKSQNVLFLQFYENSDYLLKKCEIILKKCLNVNQIKIYGLFISGRDDVIGIEKYNKLVEMIIKNCNNLSDFDFHTDYMSEENRNNFIEKFGSKIISVKFGFFM